MTFGAIQANLSFDSSLVPFLGSSIPKTAKGLLNSFGANGLQMQKGQNWIFPTLKNYLYLERFNQIYHSICDLCHSKEAPYQKKKKVTEACLRLTPPPLLTDGQTNKQMDDGQLGIGKTPLSFGWRS